ncbi:MAG: EAL domain-containing protein [Actinomycetota bacterium]|nr:EAL domain-containing protein [Actinomycetota bacterium]
MGELKVDRGFVAGMAGSQADRHIVGATVELGHKLGLSVVAEGVEDADTAEALHDLGCDRARGYHWSPPLPPAQLAEWLDGWAARAAARAGWERG